MRAWLLAMALATALAACAVVPSGMSEASPAIGATQSAGSFAGTRVKVQLVTLGAALVLVVCVGTAAYVVRRKLGLDAQPPPEGPSSQH
jgi:hypothetical protein